MQNLWMLGIMVAALVGSGAVVGMGIGLGAASAFMTPSAEAGGWDIGDIQSADDYYRRKYGRNERLIG